MNTTNTNSNLLSYPVHWLLWETPNIIQIRDVNGYAGAARYNSSKMTMDSCDLCNIFHIFLTLAHAPLYYLNNFAHACTRS